MSYIVSFYVGGYMGFHVRNGAVIKGVSLGWVSVLAVSSQYSDGAMTMLLLLDDNRSNAPTREHHMQPGKARGW